MRKKSLCCKPNGDAVKELKCDADLCAFDLSLCEDFLPDNDDSSRRRAITDNDNGNNNDIDNPFVIRIYINPFDGHEYEYLEARNGDKFPGRPRPLQLRVGGMALNWVSRAYPNTLNKLFKGDGASTTPLRGGF